MSLVQLRLLYEELSRQYLTNGHTEQKLVAMREVYGKILAMELILASV